MRVKLLPVEQRLVTHLAEVQRQNFERNAKDTITLYGEKKKAGYGPTLLNGLGAEVAFCRAMNVYPSLDPTSHAPYDCTLHTGHKVDVKQSTGNCMHIKRTHADRAGKVHLYALMVGTFPAYRLAGFIRAEDALQERFMDYGQDEPCYTIPERELKRLEDV